MEQHVERLSFFAPATDVDMFKMGAAARGLTQGEYMSKLLRLYETVRVRADAGDAISIQVLKGLSLEAVTI